MALSQTPEVGDKLRYWIFTDEYEVTHIDDSGTVTAKTKNGTSFRITEDDFELFVLVSKGADNMALTQTPKVGDKVRHIDGSHVYDISRYDEWGNAVITLPDLGDCGLIMEEDFEEFELISEGADDMTKPNTRAEYWADKRREIEGATYTAEQRQARKGERIVIVEPNEHDSEDYERGDIFRVDKVDSAGVTTTTGNIVYHEEYEVLPGTVADQFGGVSSEDAASAMNTALGKAYGSVDSLDDIADNVHSPQHYRQGGVEVIDIIRDAVRDADGFEAVCHANVIKYVLRYRYKNGVEDLRKSRVYLDWLIAELERK